MSRSDQLPQEALTRSLPLHERGQHIHAMGQIKDWIYQVRKKNWEEGLGIMKKSPENSAIEAITRRVIEKYTPFKSMAYIECALAWQPGNYELG